MLKRKVTTPKSASRTSHRNGSPAKAKTAPVHRRFVISSKAIKPDAGKSKVSAPVPAVAKPLMKLPTNGQTTGAPPMTTSVDLSETIKTLLHLAQEHGYVTYDDINDVLPDGLNPDDLDELFTKLRSLDVEIVDQAEAERTAPKPAE